MSKKILLLGFDALSWGHMKNMMNQGKLPNFSKLAINSTYGSLESVYPPGSYIAWPSYMTGVNPGKHSLFYPIVFKEKFEYAGRPFDTSMINYPTIYEILSEAGFSVGVVNHPAAFPPIKVDGFFISKPPSQNSNFTYPESFKDEILAKYPNYGSPLERNLDRQITINDALDKLSLNYEVSKFCFTKYDSDIKASIFLETDTLSHWYWDKPDLIDKIYEHCDSILGKLVKAYGSNHDIIVFSDHGFGRCLSIFHPNVWLEKLGLLVWKSKIIKPPIFSKFRKESRNIARSVFNSLGIGYSRFSKSEDKSKNTLITELSDSIDWNKTKIYFREDMGFRFNILGREQKGKITLSDASKIYNRIKKEVVNLRDPNNPDYQPFKGLIRNKEVFNGPHVKNSPDFYIDVNDNYNRGFSSKYNDNLFERNSEQPGKHAMDGIFFIKSKDANKNKNIKSMNIVSLLPNILFLLGIEGRKYFDGKINKNIFTNDFKSTNEYKISDTAFSFDREEVFIDDKDRQSITEFWKKVGYL